MQLMQFVKALQGEHLSDPARNTSKNLLRSAGSVRWRADTRAEPQVGRCDAAESMK